MAMWLMLVLSGTALLAIGDTRNGVQASRNRITLLRAAWLADACMEILAARYSDLPRPDPATLGTGLDSVALGPGVWCRLRLHDPSEKLNLNRASPVALAAVVGDSALTSRILAARPVPALGALRLDASGRAPDVTRLERLLTTRGPGTVNLNRAEEAVLAGVPGLGPDGARALATWRAGGRTFASVDEVLAALPPPARLRVLAQYPAFVAATTLAPAQLVAVAEGHVGASRLSAVTVLTVIPAGPRLAVIRREAS